MIILFIVVVSSSFESFAFIVYILYKVISKLTHSLISCTYNTSTCKPACKLAQQLVTAMVINTTRDKKYSGNIIK